MTRGSFRRFALLLLTTSLVFAASTAALGAAKDRKTLVLRGRITGSDGWPLVGARVRARTVAPEVQKGRVSAGDAGQFTLQIPLGSPAELVGKPLTIRVGAESPGWRLGVVGGDAEVGFDLRVVTGEDGIARCEVRSNHAEVGAALVRLLTADGEATQTVGLSFLGTRGEPVSEAPGNLTLVDRVPLAGAHIAVTPPAETKSPAVTAPAPPPVAVPVSPLPAATQPTKVEPKAPSAAPSGTAVEDTTHAKAAAAQAATTSKTASPSRSSARSTSTATSSPRTSAKPPPPRNPARSAAEDDLKRRAMERDSARRAVEQAMLHAASGRGAVSHPVAQDTAALIAQQEKLRRAALAESTRLVREEEARRTASADSARRATEEAARIAASDAKARRDSAKVSARMAAAAEAARRNTARDSLRRVTNAQKESARVAAQSETHRRSATQDSARRAAQAEIALRNQVRESARLAAAAEATRRAVVQDSIRRASDDASRHAAQEQGNRMSASEAIRRAAAERAQREADMEAIRRENMAQADKRAAELRRQREATRPAAPRDTMTPVTAVTPPPVRTVKDAITSTVNPKSDGEVRARSAPMVIRAIAPPALADGEPCSCRIEGTVEVSSNKPLPKRARVTISLVPNPAINTTVELFMGSPREFRLTGPCGPQRLRVMSLSTMHFAVVSQDALNGFQCEPGGLHQFRIVLKPRR